MYIYIYIYIYIYDISSLRVNRMKSKINPDYLCVKFQFASHGEHNVLPMEGQSVNVVSGNNRCLL